MWGGYVFLKLPNHCPKRGFLLGNSGKNSCVLEPGQAVEFHSGGGNMPGRRIHELSREIISVKEAGQVLPHLNS